MKKPFRFLLPVIIVFVVLVAGLFIFRTQLEAKGFDFKILLVANVFLLLLQFVSFAMQHNALKNSNPNVFIRSVMGGMMLKMFGSVALVLGYTLMSGDSFNKRSVFLAMLLYLVYLGAEVIAISRLNKQKDG